jgi:m7GpppX diphosphatase
LYLLVIFVDEGLHSIRDLRGCHINLLKNCEKEVNKILASQFGLDEGTCRMFFHYPPTFYQLHVHVTNLRCQAANALVERAHLLQNVINNLEVDSNYYCKVSLMKTVEK